MLALLPALLAALSGVWCGTFADGASWAGSAAAAVLPLALLAAAGVDSQDPLRLGRSGRLLPAALWIAVAASAWASPVPRAGRVALILLPAYLALPGAVARCWSSEAARRIGLRALAGAVGGVALLAFAGIVGLHTERASLPLGHHNLLAAWLVILLPLALLPAREAGGWRWLGWGSALAGAAAVLASRSFLGIAALVIEVLMIGIGAIVAIGLGWRKDKRLSWLAGGVVLLLLLGGTVEGPRVLRILSGTDRSGQARAVYYRAGWEGFLARPVLGWGPGSAAWTASLFLRPRPGVNPPGEVVGELHSLPVQIAYELGVTGLLLAGALAALFLLRRIAERRAAEDRPLLAAGLLGLLGAAVTSLGSASVAVTALPVAACLAAGAALAESNAPQERIPLRLPALAYGVVATLLLSPLLRASYHYDQAIAAPTPRQSKAHLSRAVGLDPSFPLYRARFGWLLASSDRGRGADLALRSAEDASGVGSLWLAAGVLGLGASRPWAPRALAEACARDPLSPFSPYFLAVAAPGSPDAPRRAAHALLAEPRLLAAPFWDAHSRLREAALREVGAQRGIDPGWREALLRATLRRSPPPPGSLEDVERGWLALEIDPIPSLSLSLYAFRRKPWPLEWPLVEVRQAALAGLDLPPASALETSAATAFRCDLSSP
jgi:O-antigen ligase